MIFNSIEFAFFFPLVFILYWTLFRSNVKLRNWFLLAVSYFFYGAWDWRFLILIFISTAGDYLFGILIDTSEQHNKRKIFLISSMVLNLGILGFFKYFNFFTDSFVHVFTLFGKEINYQGLNIILPVGISFYTFQTMSYTIDIYFKNLKATRDAVSFFAFVSFFPQLVAGPIERAKDLLPQFFVKHEPDYKTMKSGLLQIAVGLFQKIMIADRLSVFVDNAFKDIDNTSGLPMLMALLFFSFQLYLDFAAYSRIAIGSARLLGFELSTNFNRPYLASSFTNFWTRWHISLSSWFRDYVYIPLGGNRTGKTTRNIMIVFLLSGLWHGASWNFVIWGGLNGLFLILIDKILNRNGEKKGIIKSIIVFACWTLSLLFFRGATFHDAIQGFFNLGFSNAEKLYEYGLNALEFKMIVWLLIGLLTFEILTERGFDIVAWLAEKPIVIRYSFYILLVALIIMFGAYGVGNDNQFIYFQF